MHRTPIRTCATAAIALLLACLAAGSFTGPATAAGGEPFAPVTGVVRTLDGKSVVGARVLIQGGVTFTDATGRYTEPVVNFGPREVAVSAPCLDPVVTTIEVAGPTKKNFTLVHDRDATGHVCRSATPNGSIAPGIFGLVGDDVTGILDLPFPFPFYGKLRTRAFVSTNGYLTFTPRAEGTEDFRNAPLTDPTAPADGIFAFWDDLVIDGQGLRFESTGTAPNRILRLQWADARLFPTDERITAALTMHESGRIEVDVASTSTSERARGGSATIGIKDPIAGVGGQTVTRSVDTAFPDFPAADFVTDQAPVAKAGADKVVASGTTFTLDGSASTDPDGKVGLAFKWTQISGPSTVVQTPGKPKTLVTGIKGPATLTYQLRVVDPFDRTSTDTVKVTVKAPA